MSGDFLQRFSRWVRTADLFPRSGPSAEGRLEDQVDFHSHSVRTGASPNRCSWASCSTRKATSEARSSTRTAGPPPSLSTFPSSRPTSRSVRLHALHKAVRLTAFSTPYSHARQPAVHRVDLSGPDRADQLLRRLELQRSPLVSRVLYAACLAILSRRGRCSTYLVSRQLRHAGPVNPIWRGLGRVKAASGRSTRCFVVDHPVMRISHTSEYTAEFEARKSVKRTMTRRRASASMTLR